MKAKILKWLAKAPKWIIWVVGKIFWLIRNKKLLQDLINEGKKAKKAITGQVKEIKKDDKITKEEVVDLINLIVKTSPEVAEAFVKLILAK